MSRVFRAATARHAVWHWPGDHAYTTRPADVHALDDRCFWCASGAEAAAPAGTGWRWGATTEQCPFWTNATEVTR